ncbi:MAG: hypothetical protein ACLQBX_15860 [Candidatus Limnocylindrales bacterium]
MSSYDELLERLEVERLRPTPPAPPPVSRLLPGTEIIALVAQAELELGCGCPSCSALRRLRAAQIA